MTQNITHNYFELFFNFRKLNVYGGWKIGDLLLIYTEIPHRTSFR